MSDSFARSTEMDIRAFNRMKDKCDCAYMCRRVQPEKGYQYVSPRTGRRHREKDRRGELASDIAVERERARETSSILFQKIIKDIPSSAPVRPYPSRTTLWRWRQLTKPKADRSNVPLPGPSPIKHQEVAEFLGGRL